MRWERCDPGWYYDPATGHAVCREKDGLWHVYVVASAPPGDSSHRTLKHAKKAAEKFAKENRR